MGIPEVMGMPEVIGIPEFMGIPDVMGIPEVIGIPVEKDGAEYAAACVGAKLNDAEVVGA